jgi:membrane-bound inhibitor of C-type lysozyme
MLSAHTRRRPLLALPAILLAAACAQPGFESPLLEQDVPPGSFRFVCAGDVSFLIDFERDGAISHLTAGGMTYTLPQAVAASGARYEADGVEFWEHRGEATLKGAAGGPYENCRRG